MFIIPVTLTCYTIILSCYNTIGTHVHRVEHGYLAPVGYAGAMSRRPVLHVLALLRLYQSRWDIYACLIYIFPSIHPYACFIYIFPSIHMHVSYTSFHPSIHMHATYIIYHPLLYLLTLGLNRLPMHPTRGYEGMQEPTSCDGGRLH